MTTFGETATAESARSGSAAIARASVSREPPKRLHAETDADSSQTPTRACDADARRPWKRSGREKKYHREVPSSPIGAQPFLSFRPYHQRVSFGRDVGPELRARSGTARPSRGAGTLRVVLLSAAFVVGAVGLSGLWQGLAFPALQADTRALEASRPATTLAENAVDETGATDPGDAAAAIAAAGARTSPGDPPGWVRIPKPAVPSGPRRVGIQAGHWRTSEAPPELWQLLSQTGASAGGATETQTNLEIAEKVAAILRGRGIVADVLPTIIPPGYLADAFVALHSDGDESGVKSGFKLAHATRRTPHEDALQRELTEEYGAATGLDYDAAGVSRNMTGYYALSWSRIRYATSPFTPSVVLEMGFLTNRHDRDLIVNQQDLLAHAIATGILTFLEATPRDALFGQDLVVPPLRSRFATPSPTPGT